jgi:hypothetical protein
VRRFRTRAGCATLRFLSLYQGALTADEVKRNFDAGIE